MKKNMIIEPESLYWFFVGPAIILIGMAGTGAIIDGFLKSSNTFKYLFFGSRRDTCNRVLFL
jgi:hypothetical protein